MSKYTTEVRYICENIARSKDKDIDLYDMQNVVALSWRDILNLDMAIDLSIIPIENEFVLQHLEKITPHILLQNYTREIGCETVGLWKFRMQNKLNSILPYYADLFETLTLKYNPLEDTDYTSVREDLTNREDNFTVNESVNDIDTRARQTAQKYDSSKYGISKSTNDSSDRYSDTPQGTVQYLEISNNMFLTNARLNSDEANGEYADTVDDTNNITENETKNKAYQRANSEHRYIENGGTDTTTVKGKSSGVSYAKLIKEYRSALLNINQMFFDEFKDMFMLIY